MTNKITCKPFLKWAGGKFRLVPLIQPLLPKAPLLIEPFVGAASVFLNTNYPAYRLGDINPDLIHLYRTLQHFGEDFIDYTRRYFTAQSNSLQFYSDSRDEFNRLGYSKSHSFKKAALFIYLNRHGYNGLCRYNRLGKFNVPFGRYKTPLFPETALRQFFHKSARAEFYCEDFHILMHNAKKGSVIYCDPPYVPITSSAYFTAYSQDKFGLQEQQALAKAALMSAKNGCTVIISNHDTRLTRQLYASGKIQSFNVQRMISRSAQRGQVAELLAVFCPSTSTTGIITKIAG